MNIEITADELFARVGRQTIQIEKLEAENKRLVAECEALKAIPRELPQEVRDRMDAMKAEKALVNGEQVAD